MRRVVPSGELRTADDGNKRYRPLLMHFDTRARTLTEPIGGDWEPSIKEQHRQNKENAIRGLATEFGELEIEGKVKNFVDLGVKPFSVMAYHNHFLDQARSAFIMGAYYPALVGACTLGERILNHLIINLRDEFKTSPHYKNVYRSKSFDGWDKMITPLSDWKVLLPTAADDFRELNRMRNHSVHFRHELDADARTPALDAIRLLQKIIGTQFSALGGGHDNSRWFIPGTPGASFLRREAEDLPFIRLVFIPNSFLVSNQYSVHFTSDGVMVTDEVQASTKELTDDEFARGEL